MPDPPAPPSHDPATVHTPSGEDLWTRLPSAAERWIERAAWIERAGRAAWRRLAQGEPPFRAEDRQKLTSAGRAAAAAASAIGSSATGSSATAASAIAASPLIYLPALPWAGRFQRPQQLALAVARRGAPVLWAEAFLRTRVQPPVWITRPESRLRVVRFPLPGRPDPFRHPFPPAAVDALAGALLAGRTASPRALLVQLPFWAPLAYELRRRSGRPLIYDRLDLHTGFPGVPATVGEVEEDLIRHSDLVTCSSPHLAEISRGLSRRTLLLPNAVDPAVIESAPYRAPQRALRAGEPATVAGFVGALDARIDGDAIDQAARRLPAWRFRLAGRVEHPPLGRLAELPNVELLGEIPHAGVPGFLRRLDVGLIPYRDTPLTRAIDPVKLYEMLAAGLPVVRRELPGAPAGSARASHREQLRPPVVYPYADPDDLPTVLKRARNEDSTGLHSRRTDLAAGESWDHRAASLLKELDDLCELDGVLC